jgi:F0F1-type ATP synthase assembly protein I
MATESGQPEHSNNDDAQAGFARMAVWLLRVQASLVVVGSLVAAVVWRFDAGLGLLAGGGIGILLTAIAALRVGMIPASAGAASMTAAFYRAMAMKLFVAVVLFVIVAKWFSGYFGPVLMGYVVTLVAYWLALWRLAQLEPMLKQHDER